MSPWQAVSQRRHRALVWLLCLAGATEILAFGAVVMPRSWMESAHAWLGMGAMPDGPVIMFMIRQASYFYGMHGISLCILATDPPRYRPLIVFNGWMFLLAGPLFLAIDLSVKAPLPWTVVDTLGCGLLGAALLWLAPRKPDAASRQAAR